MIDTVKFICEPPVLAKIPCGKYVRNGWKMVDKRSGLRAELIYAKGRHTFKSWEVSLPKVIFGRNDKLISTQEMLSEAIERTWTLLSKFADTSKRTGHFERVDLCWQFPFNPQSFILAHKDINHPRFNGDVLVWRGKARIQGLAYQGADKSRISFYDKTDYTLPHTKRITRVEIQLKKRRARMELSNHRKITSLDIHSAYATYRRILLQFGTPKPVPKVTNRDALLLYAERKGFPLLDYCSRGLTNDHLKRIRKQRINVNKVELEIDWAQLLPADFPPQILEPHSIPRYRLNFKK